MIGFGSNESEMILLFSLLCNCEYKKMSVKLKAMLKCEIDFNAALALHDLNHVRRNGFLDLFLVDTVVRKRLVKV